MMQAITENNTDSWNKAKKINHVSKSQRVLFITSISSRTVAGNMKSWIEPAIKTCCLKRKLKKYSDNYQKIYNYMYFKMKLNINSQSLPLKLEFVLDMANPPYGIMQ